MESWTNEIVKWKSIENQKPICYKQGGDYNGLKSDVFICRNNNYFFIAAAFFYNGVFEVVEEDTDSVINTTGLEWTEIPK
jgi:hypothetical protein